MAVCDNLKKNQVKSKPVNAVKNINRNGMTGCTGVAGKKPGRLNKGCSIGQISFRMLYTIPG